MGHERRAAQSYVVSALAPAAKGPTESTLYLVSAEAPGISVASPWDGLGLRANASAPMTLEDCEVSPELQLTDDGAGFQAMLEVVLPLFNSGATAVALGLCRAAVAGTAAHLKGARFEHLGQSLGVIGGAGHMVQMEAANAVNSLLKEHVGPGR